MQKTLLYSCTGLLATLPLIGADKMPDNKFAGLQVLTAQAALTKIKRVPTTVDLNQGNNKNQAPLQAIHYSSSTPNLRVQKHFAGNTPPATSLSQPSAHTGKIQLISPSDPTP